jgi:hypothetical protein
VNLGLGDAQGLIFVGAGRADLYPFFGGHLYIDVGSPWLGIRARLEGATGWPGGGYLDLPLPTMEPPLTLFFQGAFLDPGAMQGVSLTNGLEVQVKN